MTALVLVAAGSGQRLGADVPKALVRVAGETLIGHCLNTTARVPAITEVVVVVPASHLEEVAAVCDAKVVPGGSTRDESVRAGLAALTGDHEFVLIHDAARPFVQPAVFERVMAALFEGAIAVVPAIPVADTIKRVEGGYVVQTVDRSELVAVQTPQGFDLASLRAAHAAQVADVTDDAMLMEAMGHRVRVVPGSDEAYKVTTPFDLAVATALRAQQRRQ